MTKQEWRAQQYSEEEARMAQFSTTSSMERLFDGSSLEKITFLRFSPSSLFCLKVNR